ncbi:pyridoxal phosphate-dependent aminotransferase [Alkaliphilus sp. B6464]|nr:pyridoxal phosphate-dependent aminotransferase [Alkaliphilus sp. B6464]QUH21680.1 pyridoxal phosphate-dependent aminotransferase [Alkaliphilus sp. B6464]
MALSRKAQNVLPSITLSIDAKAKQMKADGINVISFGVGEPDFTTPQNIKDAAIEAIRKGFTTYTPASGLPQLKQAICAKLKTENNLEYKPENIVVSNGAKHSLYNIFQAICNPGDEVIIPVPYWVSYPDMVKMADANPVFVNCTEENEFKIKIDDLLKAITPKTKAIILNSPSNPTGSVYTKSELEEIAKIAIEHNIFIVADEIYEKLTYEGEKHISIASLNDQIKDLTIVVNGMSKGYAMTGWRIGYTASHATIAKAMGNMQSHATSNPNTIAQHASIEGLTGDQSSVEEMRIAFDERRKYMVQRINEIKGLSCITPKGAFYVMMNIKQLIGTTIKGIVINSSMDLSELLLEHANVAVVPGVAFGTDEFIRLSYANSLENIKEGLNRIDSILNS